MTKKSKKGCKKNISNDEIKPIESLLGEPVVPELDNTEINVEVVSFDSGLLQTAPLANFENLVKKSKYPPLNLIFNKSEHNSKEIAEIIGLLSELYANIGGDYLEIVGMNFLELPHDNDPHKFIK